eukprot:TRINITY_DN20065_c0_g2_i1.p1 TRINITY_DN20065_c0_g2~~TRINITY_DN20065_c0_g2_i1.p1  ORF type:complete len:239 (-),score=30.03 TRINITY_DN20065_c0_g2_i1:165-881(-)
MSAIEIATSKFGLFQHALAMGMLLLVTGLAGTAVQQHCGRDCEFEGLHTKVELDVCMRRCRIYNDGMTEVEAICKTKCELDLKPHTTYDNLTMAIKHCSDTCFPPPMLIFAVHQSGSALILLTMAVLFCARSSCRHSRFCKQPCVAYAWCFFIVSVLLFFIGLTDITEIIGVQVAFILASTFSICCEALVELRESVLEPEEKAAYLERRFGITPSIFGHSYDHETEDETDTLQKDTWK